MRYWWVNQNKTFDQEFKGNYIWCPKRRADGFHHPFYESLREISPGDLIFSLANSTICAFGYAQTHCYSCPKPDEFGSVGDIWDEKGWRVDVNFTKFTAPFRPKDFADRLAQLLPPKYSLIRKNGVGNQGTYCAEISKPLAVEIAAIADPTLGNLLRFDVESHEPAFEIELPPLFEWEERQQEIIEHESGISETTRRALVLARRGQGLFKERVYDYEKACRITKVNNPTHLIASHIKPWRESDDEERLAPGNGLMLTPSIDHLFDRGFISFADEGDLIVSPIADTESLKKMGVDTDVIKTVGTFNSDQQHFLNYHREEILLQSAS